MKDLEQKMAAGEPLVQQAMDALRRYNEAKALASPEELKHLELQAVSLMEAVQEYQLRMLGGSTHLLH